MNGDVVAGPGGMVQLRVTLFHDGGVVPARIPVENDFGAPGVTVSSGGMMPQSTPATAGRVTFRFGWDGGLRDDRFVDVAACNVAMCGAWQYCINTVAGGQCADTVVALTWQAPDGGPYAPGVMVPIAVQVTTVDGGAFQGNVPVTGAATTTLVSASNLKTGFISTPSADGVFTLFAGWDGGPKVPLTSRVDAVGPVLTWRLQVDGGLGGGKRDELVLAQVESSEALQAAPQVALQDAGVRLVGTGPCAGWTCGRPRCDCYELDLAAPDLPQLTGQFGLQATARDVYGNSGSGGAVVPVTRLRWRVDVSAPGGSVARTAPSIDSQGALYLGTDDSVGGTTGRLMSLTPAGLVRSGFPVSTGAVQSVSVASTRIDTTNTLVEVVYANSNVVTGSRIDMYLTSGAQQGVSLVDASRKSYSALALFRANSPALTPEVGAAAVFNTGTVGVVDGQVGSATPLQTDTSGTNAEYMVPVPGASAPNSPVNAIVFGRDGGSELVFATDDAANPRTLKSHRFVSGAWQMGSSSPGLGLSGSPVALSGAGVATYLAMTTVGASLLVSKGLQTPVSIGAPGFGTLTTAYAPVIASRTPMGAVNASALFGSNFNNTVNWLLSSPTDTGAASVLDAPLGLTAPTSTSRLVTSPVIGGGGLPHGAGGTADRLYAVTQDGALRAFVVSPTTGTASATAEWAATPTEVFGGPKTVYAHPTMDCTRPSVVGRPGVLYVVATDGTVAAILVDSSKLSTTAPWPKWQRTAGNAGNDDEGLFPRNPGCN